MIVAQPDVIAVEGVRTGQIQWMEGVRQRGGKDDPEGLGLSNQKDRVAIIQGEKCLGGAGLGKTRNSPFVMLSLRCLLDKQVEISSRQLIIVWSWRGRV